jgi:hypothetical protein
VLIGVRTLDGTPVTDKWVVQMALGPPGPDSTVVTEIYDCSRSPE